MVLVFVIDHNREAEFFVACVRDIAFKKPIKNSPRMQSFFVVRRFSAALLLVCLLSMQFAAAACMQARITLATVGAAAVPTYDASSGPSEPGDARRCASHGKAVAELKKRRNESGVEGFVAAATQAVLLPYPVSAYRTQASQHPFETLPAAPPLRIRHCTYRI